MRRLTLAVILLCVAASLLSVAALAKECTPPGSFLKYRAGTVGELLNQISTDPTVRMRYAQHFGIDPAHVATSLKIGLKLVALNKPAKVQTWYVGRAGLVHSKTKLLPKGTLVFAGPDNRPLLAWSCGNPLRADIPGQALKPGKQGARSGKQIAATGPSMANGMTGERTKVAGNASTAENEQAKVMGTSASAAADNVQTKVLAGPVETVGTEPVSAVPGLVPTTEAAAVQDADPMVVAQAFPAAAAPALAAAAPVAAGASAAGLLEGLGGLAGLFGGLAATRGHSHPAPAVVVPGAVPEPGGIVVLVMGLALSIGGAMAAGTRRRQPLQLLCRRALQRRA